MLRTPRARQRAIAILTAVALGFGLAACGEDSDDSTGSPSDLHTAADGIVYNDADIEFATDMIPHHAQAVAMVTLSDGRQLDPAVQQLAGQIRDAQVPEVETMVDWLTSWGEEVPETSLDHSNAGHDMDMESNDMPGMMSDEDMNALENASDEEFQAMWLEMMIEHHRGAIEMAETEAAEGRYPDAVSMARSIKSSQEAEIGRIEQLLGR